MGVGPSNSIGVKYHVAGVIHTSVLILHTSLCKGTLLRGMHLSSSETMLLATK